jgi:hypothetical protein
MPKIVTGFVVMVQYPDKHTDEGVKPGRYKRVSRVYHARSAADEFRALFEREHGADYKKVYVVSIGAEAP